MKKALLTLVSLAMTLVSVAQSWTEPKLEISSADYVQEFKTSVLSAEDGDSTFYYLYNVDAKAFLTQGLAWDTQAAIAIGSTISGPIGNKVVVAKHEPSADAAWDGKTYIIKDYGANNGGELAWREIFIDTETACYVDHRDQPNYMWEIESQGNSIYRIKGADVNPDFNAAKLEFDPYWGWDANTAKLDSLNPLVILDTKESDAKLDWAFIAAAKVDLYNARLTLYTRLNEAAEKGVDYSSASAVYNNASATIEDVQAASSALRRAIIDKEFEGVTADNPMDVTSWIVNASFSGNVNGWNVGFVSGTNANNVGYQSASYENGEVKISQFIEAWANNTSSFNKNVDAAYHAIGVGELTQTLKDMPSGTYKFTVDCIANQQYVAAGNPVVGVELFATGGSVDVFQNVATGNGLPEHFEVYFNNDADEIKLGLRTTENCTANWIAADNFTLTFYGKELVDPKKIELNEIITAALEKHPVEELDDVVAYTGDKENFKTVIAEAKAATDNYTEYVDKVNGVVKALDASIAAYEAYIAETERIEDYLGNNQMRDNDYTAYLSDYFNIDPLGPDEVPENGNKAYILENLKLDTKAIIAETDTIGKILQLAITSGLEPGDDCTDMLVNASFEKGFEGWTTNNGTFGGLKAYPCVEVYGAPVDVYQVINNVPDGVYALTCQAFERAGGNGSYDGTEKSKVFLFMNELQTPVQSIVASAIPEELAEDKVNCFKSGGNPDEDFYSTGGTTNADYFFDGDNGSNVHGYVPNGMSGASYAFRAGRYEQTVYGLVEGGTMKIGLTSNGVTPEWVLWSQFKLKYLGTDAAYLILEAQNNALDEAITKLDSYLGENELTDPEFNAASKVVDDAGNVYDYAYELADPTADSEEINAAIDSVKATIALVEATLESAKKNVEALKALSEAYDALSDIVNNPVVDNPSQEALDAATALIESYDEGDYLNLTTEEVKTLTEQFKDAASALRIPGNVTGSDDDPYDMTDVIVNADIEAGAKVGWSYTKNCQNGPELDNGLVGKSIEFWDGKPENLQFNIWQTLVSLPAGKYELTAVAANALNGEADPGNTGRAFLYAETFVTGGDSTAYSSDSLKVTVGDANNLDNADTLSVIFTVEEGQKVNIGIKSSGKMTARWFVADEFHLYYYGTESKKEDSGDPSGVEAIEAAGAEIVAIYSASGAQVSALQPGLNIVKYADGTVKKIFVK